MADTPDRDPMVGQIDWLEVFSTDPLADVTLAALVRRAVTSSPGEADPALVPVEPGEPDFTVEPADDPLSAFDEVAGFEGLFGQPDPTADLPHHDDPFDPAGDGLAGDDLANEDLAGEDHSGGWDDL